MVAGYAIVGFSLFGFIYLCVSYVPSLHPRLLYHILTACHRLIISFFRPESRVASLLMDTIILSVLAVVSFAAMMCESINTSNGITIWQTATGNQ
jgi:prolipoprotein diacylglyceryltransferase